MKTRNLAIVVLLATLSCKQESKSTAEITKPIETAKPVGIKTYPLNGNNVFPEGITIDHRNGTIFTGSVGEQSVQTTKDSKSSYFINPGDSSISKNVLGLAVDEKNNRLWVCSNDLKSFFDNKDGSPTISVYDLSDKSLIKKFEVSDVIENSRQLVNDIIVDSQGNIYATNSSYNAIIRISSDLETLEVIKDFPLAPDGQFYILNGIELTNDENSIIVVSYKTGYENAIAILFKIDIKTHAITEINVNSISDDFKLNGIDGICFIDAHSLIGVSGNSKLLKVEFNNNYNSATITDISTGTKAEQYLNIATTVDTYNNKLYVTNAQVSSYFSNSEDVQRPFQVIEIPYEILSLK